MSEFPEAVRQKILFWNFEEQYGFMATSLTFSKMFFTKTIIQSTFQSKRSVPIFPVKMLKELDRFWLLFSS